MRMKNLPIFLALTTVLLSGCVHKQTQLPAEPVVGAERPAKAGNRQTVSPDIYRSAPEVVRYDHYRLVDISPSRAQQYPLEQIIHLRIPPSVSPTVGDALHYALRESGYRLCSVSGQANVLYRQPLPAVQSQLGPVRLSDALQIFGGPAWQVDVDEVQRVACHSLRQGYQLPAPGVTRSVSIVSRTRPVSPRPVAVQPVISAPAASGDKVAKPVHRGGWLK